MKIYLIKSYILPFQKFVNSVTVNSQMTTAKNLLTDLCYQK